MPDRPATTLHRRRFLTAGLTAVLAACAGEATTDDQALDGATAEPSPTSSPSPEPTASPSPSPSPATDPAELAAQSPTGADLPTGIVPTRIEIPAIGVDATCVELQLRASEIEVPDFGLAGWWVQTRKPGEIGPALMGAHVDSTSGPDVFFRLKDLRPGDEVTVTDDAGETRSFVVDAEPIQTDKQERPPEVLGFGEPRPELRLITCGGDFNPAVGSYDSNVVVFCHDPSYDA